MQRQIRAVRPAVNVLVGRGLLKTQNECGKVGYAISEKGIEYVEFRGIVKIRNWVVE